jgi:hypothetical protein
MRSARPLRQLFRIVVEPVWHPPVRGQLMLTVPGRIGERAESFRFESRNRVGIGLEVDDVTRDKRDHASINKDALTAKHTADGHRAEFAEEFVDRLGVHAERA